VRVKDVRTKIFQSIDFFLNFHCSQTVSYLLDRQKKLGVTDFVSEIKHVENYPDFEKIGTSNSAWSTGVYS